MIDFTVKIGGEAGFGIMTTGLVLGKIAIRSGYYAYEYSEYPSLIRGGHNVVEVRISNEPVYSQEQKVDILVCLNEETYEKHKDELKDHAVVLYDKQKTNLKEVLEPNKNITYIDLPLSKILTENGFPIVMMNNIALGALMHIIGADLNLLNQIISESFGKKSQEIVDKNIKAAGFGYDSVKQSYPSGYNLKIGKKENAKAKIYATGNEIIGLGAIAAGCKFYVAYPMTPSSALLHYLAANAEKADMVVKHAEDEISVINMALGASWAGVRSMVGTSGGGFALMVETIALAGITEIPVVILLGQRPGPATGMPTWTEQGDLLFALFSGHGEFPKILLAPGDIDEAYKLTIQAFQLADKYQTPVIILADKYLLEGHQTIDLSAVSDHKYEINRGKLLSQKELDTITKYLRYQKTADGISPRVIPGMKGSLHQANSYEHLEDGHTTEEASERKKQVDKRNAKFTTYLQENAKDPVFYGNNQANLTVISWGSMKGPLLQALKGNENLFNFLHFTHVWPLDGKKIKKILQSLKKILILENNSTAQFSKLLTMETGIQFENYLLKYDGRPIYPEEIINKVKTLL
jgi:2-oxoglutarate ferredoxin oxidoreductase subunit alpha